MTPVTNRKKIRGIISRIFNLPDDDPKVLQAADELQETFAFLRDARTLSWDMLHGMNPSEEAKANLEREKRKEALIQEIQSAFKIKLGVNIDDEFTRFVYAEHLDGHPYEKFIAWWLSTYKDRQFWSMRRFRENWSGAFMEQPNPSDRPAPRVRG